MKLQHISITAVFAITIAAFPLSIVALVAKRNKADDCTCRFTQHRVHFGDQYTKVNRKCIDLGNGSVRAGDTVYIGVRQFTNECE